MSRFTIIFKNEIFNVSTFLALAYNVIIRIVAQPQPINNRAKAICAIIFINCYSQYGEFINTLKLKYRWN